MLLFSLHEAFYTTPEKIQVLIFIFCTFDCSVFLLLPYIPSCYRAPNIYNDREFTASIVTVFNIWFPH